MSKKPFIEDEFSDDESDDYEDEEDEFAVSGDEEPDSDESEEIDEIEENDAAQSRHEAVRKPSFQSLQGEPPSGALAVDRGR